MIEELLQLRLDQALATCRQRWVLGGAAVLAAVLGTALTLADGTSGRGWATMLAVTTVAALVAVSASGTHIGTIVVAIVALQWLALGGDDSSIRSVGVAVCLYTFHSITALTASVPHTTEIDGRVLRRWARRSVYVVAATLAVWGLIIAFERRPSTGNEALTVLGLTVIAAVLVIVRRAYSTWLSTPNG